jgi:hypothetical protein
VCTIGQSTPLSFKISRHFHFLVISFDPYILSPSTILFFVAIDMRFYDCSVLFFPLLGLTCPCSSCLLVASLEKSLFKPLLSLSRLFISLLPISLISNNFLTCLPTRVWAWTSLASLGGRANELHFVVEVDFFHIVFRGRQISKSAIISMLHQYNFMNTHVRCYISCASLAFIH